MAARGLVKELWEEATCPICLDFFRDPVTIAECGHNFCRACLARTWGQTGAELSCPNCRARARRKNLRLNLQLANFVAIARRFTLQEGKEAGGGKGRVCEKHQEPLELFCKDDQAPLCVVCGRSQEHRDHEVVSLEEAAARGKRPFEAAGKERVCRKHQKPLKLFCRDDEALICVVCDRSKEHRHHETLPLEEASQEYKGQFCSCLEILKKEKERILAYKGDLVKESQDLLKQTKGEQQMMLTKFRQLRTFLDKQEKLLLAQMGDVEKEVARKRDQHLDELSAALSPLESLIREMEDKCQQPASDLLQDARSTLTRYEERETLETPFETTFPLALKWRICDFCDINHFLEGVMKQLKGTLDSGLQLHKANVTLDPITAHPELILSRNRKSVRRGKIPQDLPKYLERFDKYAFVLGCERFTTGRHFWDVLVGSEDAWAVGVARNSVRRKGDINFTPEEGFWEVGKLEGRYRASSNVCDPLQTLSGEPKKIRVFLNYVGERVAFFDADKAALIYEFCGASFSGKALLPLFWVRSNGHLQLS